MKKEIHSLHDVREYFRLKKTTNRQRLQFQKTSSMGKFLIEGKLSSHVTEAFILHLLQIKRILPQLKNYEFSFGKGCDVCATNGRQNLKIEVKATGDKQFSQFTAQDLHADYVIWMDLNNYLINSSQRNINIYAIKNPGRTFGTRTCKLTVDRFLKKAKDKVIRYRYAF